jgi:hypothetical protein
MTPIKDWKWFGNAGHFICASYCQFHLCTLIGDILVSTVGQYLPDSQVRDILAESRGKPLVGKGDHRRADWMKKFGYKEIGYRRKFETMAFKSGKPCKAKGCNCGLPTIDGSEIGFNAYNDPGAATKGHMEMCLRVAQGKIKP